MCAAPFCMCRVVVARGEGCLLSGTSCVSTVRKRRRRKGRRNSPAFSVIRSSSGALERLAYSDERIRFEGRSADETAVHIGFCEEFLGVGGFARAAVEYRGGVGGSAEFFGQRPGTVVKGPQEGQREIQSNNGLWHRIKR